MFGKFVIMNDMCYGESYSVLSLYHIWDLSGYLYLMTRNIAKLHESSNRTGY